jgi:hypothetical protein
VTYNNNLMESRGYETCYRNGCISGDWLPVFRRIRREEIQKEEVAKMNLTKVGSITTSRTTSPMDARRDLSKKADELGHLFVVIAGRKTKKPFTLTLTFINNPVIKNGPLARFSHRTRYRVAARPGPDAFHRSAHHSCSARRFPFRAAFTAAGEAALALR